MKNYKLHSCQAVMPIMVEYQDEEFHDIRKAVGYVNYGQDQVLFPNNPELETDVMRRAVLAQLDTAYPKEVQVPPEVLQQIEEIRRGGLAHQMPDFYRSEG